MAADSNQRGVTYVMVMAAIVLMGISMTVVGKQWSVVIKRDKEAELAFRGNRIKTAIEWYAADYQVRKGTRPNQYPLRLEQLAEGPKRYLPVIYKDPITGQDFDLIKIGSEIRGVKSRSSDIPMDQKRFKQAGRYSEIVFLAENPMAPPCVPTLNPINPLISTNCPSTGKLPTAPPS
jgi:type II secretory pathway pseudopilin PulG